MPWEDAYIDKKKAAIPVNINTAINHFQDMDKSQDKLLPIEIGKILDVFALQNAADLFHNTGGKDACNYTQGQKNAIGAKEGRNALMDIGGRVADNDGEILVAGNIDINDFLIWIHPKLNLLTTKLGRYLMH
jgi:hypothetical protein